MKLLHEASNILYLIPIRNLQNYNIQQLYKNYNLYVKTIIY